MECAPLNLAHFHERRADKLIKRHRYEEAFKAIEASLLYVEDAYKHIQIPKAVEVLNTQKWEYERKLHQIQMYQLQYDKIKSREILPSVQIEVAPNSIKADIVNAQSIARSIDKTIKEFNDKYGSTLLENGQQFQMQSKGSRDHDISNEQKLQLNENLKNVLAEHLEKNVRRSSLVDTNSKTTDDDLPSLDPLDLPFFDYAAFGATPGLEKNLQSSD